MIDSVLKGNGNSRFLKSAVPAGTSWADALAMLQAGTFPIDFNGINAEGFQQVGTPLNKANLLKDATAAQIGLPPSTTPDGMFQALGNTGELHVWRKTVTNQQAGYDLSDVKTNGTLASGEKGYTSVALSSGSSVLVSSDGYVTIDNPNNQNFYAAQSSGWPSLSGKFIKITHYAGDGSGSPSSANSDFQVGTILYIPSDGNIAHNGSGRIYLTKYQIVTGHGAETTTTHPVSINPNAYQEGSDAKPAGYVVGDVVTGKFGMGMRYASTVFEYSVASEISASDDGTISLKNPTTFTIGGSGGYPGVVSNVTAAIAGKYIQLEVMGSATSLMSGPFSSAPSSIVYIPSDTIATREDIEDGNTYTWYFIDRYQPVTGYAAIPAGTTIEYLGKLGDKAKMQVVSYVGTGTYGSSNPSSLTFDFVPKVVMIRCDGDTNFFDAIYGMRQVVTDFSNEYYVTVKWSKKTLSWYSVDNTQTQMNDAGDKYYAIAIG